MDLTEIKRGLRAEIKKRENEQYATFQCNIRQMCKDVLAKLEEQESEIAELKQKLEDAKATAYAESVDASMRERKLKRALYNLRACYADMMQKRYIECKTDGWVHRVNKGIEVERRCIKKAEEYK